MMEPTRHRDEKGEDALKSLNGLRDRETALEIGDLPGFADIRKVADGGMGAVYLARQLRPIEREVAIKVVKLGMDTKAVISRFQAEQQILAALNHTHIAKVYDAGVTDDGRPYFVMEYVPGQGIHKYCQGKDVSLKVRLDLFLAVCGAMEHAHRQGIIHRDLKPSNILITVNGNGPEPKVIDFGIAKATRDSSLDLTQMTMAGHTLGTPEYMSPEQAKGQSHRVDQRSDIYSLGVILYQLLTGRVPFPLSKEDTGTGQEVIRHICEEEPTRPSVAILEGVSRKTDNTLGLVNGIRGDLDWIVLKALEKDPARRYQTVRDLAEDIRRHLADHPIVAGPPTYRYIVGKMVKRHRKLMLAGLVCFTILLGGLIVSTMLYLSLDKYQEELTSLADLHRYNQLVTRAEEDLWPIRPELLPRLKQWEEEAASLLLNTQFHRDSLAKLILRGQPVDRETHQNELRSKAQKTISFYTETIAEKKRALTTTQATPSGLFQGKNRADLEREISADQEKLDAFVQVNLQLSTVDNGHVFTDSFDTWRYQLLRKHLNNLEILAKTSAGESPLVDIRQRIRLVEEISERTLSSPAAKALWAQASADIAKSPVYQGLNLSPQWGLLPLKKNPLTGLWEFWHFQSGSRPAPAKPPSPNLWEVTPEMGIVFVLIPGGEFTLGAVAKQEGRPFAQNLDPRARPEEGPLQRVMLSPFFLAKYEMTQGQWSRQTRQWYMNSRLVRNRSYFSQRNELPAPTTWLVHPAEQMSWSEAFFILRRLGLVLPTEAQWEYAIRAGSCQEWPGTNDPGAVRARIGGLDRYPHHAKVGSFPPNAWGIHDMVGNVMEFCRDGSSSTRVRLRHDVPLGKGDGRRLVLDAPDYMIRGGSYGTDIFRGRSAARRTGGTPKADLGFRPARKIN